MLTYEISAETFVPQLGLTYGSPDEIAQNVAMILSLRAGTCPLARDVGLSYDWISKPAPVAQALAAVEISEKIAELETRAMLEDTNYGYDDSGNVGLSAKVVIPDG